MVKVAVAELRVRGRVVASVSRTSRVKVGVALRFTGTPLMLPADLSR